MREKKKRESTFVLTKRIVFEAQMIISEAPPPSCCFFGERKRKKKIFLNSRGYANTSTSNLITFFVLPFLLYSSSIKTAIVLFYLM
jgi:hypothetical protein